MNCPRCDEPLHGGRIGEADVGMCPSCLGVLVRQARMIPLMEALSAGLADQVDVDHPIDPAPDPGGACACPRCGHPMERFGYMETRLAHGWRCAPDWLVWADADDLGVMSVLYARTKARREARERHAEEEQEALNRRVNLILRQRIRSRMVGATAGVLF